MKVTEKDSGLLGVPNYYQIYRRWMDHYDRTGDNSSRVLAIHYARVAEEMGQAIIDDEDLTCETGLVRLK